MADFITLNGVIATEPRHIVTSEGLAITSFRLASNQRVYDRVKQDWVDKDTNWFTVTAFRQLAINAAHSFEKGQHVLVHGRLKIREWESGEKEGLSVEVEADSLGHNLQWGTSTFVRKESPGITGTNSSSPEASVEEAYAENDPVSTSSGWGVPV